MKESLSEQELYVKLSRLCASCEYSPFDIRQKAVTYGASAELADSVVGRLVDEDYVNEQRYANSFVHDKFMFNRWGRGKITAALRQKHIPTDCISQALSLIEPEEYRNVLRELLIAKSRLLRESDQYKRSRKLLAFAALRGFESGIAYDLTNEICGQDLP